MILGVKLVRRDAQLPTYADESASGFDLYAAEDVHIGPLGTAEISLGVAFEIPKGYEIQIRGRSGLAFKQNLFPHFGTIDENYRGEVKAKLFNFSSNYYTIHKGDRVAQGVLAPITRATIQQVFELSETSRNDNGFGSTGK